MKEKVYCKNCKHYWQSCLGHHCCNLKKEDDILTENYLEKKTFKVSFTPEEQNRNNDCELYTKNNKIVNKI